jgi:hypothetical protein
VLVSSNNNNTISFFYLIVCLPISLKADYKVRMRKKQKYKHIHKQKTKQGNLYYLDKIIIHLVQSLKPLCGDKKYNTYIQLEDNNNNNSYLSYNIEVELR